MTRIGKIARLPRELRDQLNRRLDDGEVHIKLVDWLNSLPQVQDILTAEFEGRVISEQNISDWKNGGFREWLLQQEALAMVRTLEANVDELKQSTAAGPLTDKLALWLTARYAVATKALQPQEDWRQLREFCFDLVLLRKGDHSAERTRLVREQLTQAQEELRKLRDEECLEWAKNHRDQLLELFNAQNLRRESFFKKYFGAPPPRIGPDDTFCPLCGQDLPIEEDVEEGMEEEGAQEEEQMPDGTGADQPPRSHEEHEVRKEEQKPDETASDQANPGESR